MRNAYIVGIAILCAFNGYLLGRILTKQWSVPDIPIIVTQNELTRIPIVQLDEIENGYAVGNIHGNVRFFFGGNLVLPNGSGAFRIAADSFLINHITITVPDGMNFVASKRGKNYYPVDSSRGSQLSPKNRLYFRSEMAAQQAGFRRAN